MANVLIIGCGDTGGRLARALADAGHDVTGVRRSARTLPGMRALRADVSGPFTLAGMPPPDYVFILLSPDTPDEAGYERTYLQGQAHIRDALEPFSPRRVFWVSSTSVYGEGEGGWVDEDTPPDPTAFNGRILLEAEARARRDWPVTVVRLAGIYGEGRLRLLRWVESGRPVDPSAWSNRIHVTDAARLLAFLMTQHAQGRELADTYIGVDDCPALQAEVLDWLAARLGLPPVPRTAAAGAPRRRLSNRRVHELGFEFRYPDYRAGYAALPAADGGGYEH